MTKQNTAALATSNSNLEAAEFGKHMLCGLNRVEILQMRWNNEEDIENVTQKRRRVFNVILAADCLFFEDFHDHLISVLKLSLALDGVIFLMQPRRAGSMERFISKAGIFFNIELYEDYCAEVNIAKMAIKDEAIYNEDVHFPILLILRLK
jgi:hypothetical protein